MSEKTKSYIAIIEVNAETTFFPEKITGNVDDANAIITLTGKYQDGKAWKISAPRKDLGIIRWQNVDEEATEEPKKSIPKM